MTEMAAHGVEEFLRVERLVLELRADRADDRRVAVPEHVDAEPAEAVDELLAVDVVEHEPSSRHSTDV